MQLLNQIRRLEARHILMLSAFVIMLFQGANDSSTSSERMASASNDPYTAVMVRKAELVFVGSVVRLLHSDCARSGLVPSRQGIVFEVRRVLKGNSDLQGKLTAYYSLVGKPNLEVLVEGCNQLAPDLFEVGREFIIACDQFPNVDPGGRWVITGGPWVADRDTEKIVVNEIAKGDVGLAQEVWLNNEIDVECFIQGKDIPDESVLRAIWKLGELSGSPSSQQGKGIESLCRSALQTDLDGWREWYEKYHHCLVWDKSRLTVRVDEPCIGGKHE